MAGEKKVADTAELEAAAWELFVERSPAGMHSTQAERLTRQCFQDAAAFQSVAAKIAGGEDVVPAAEKPGLDIAFAPNLKKTHPINLVSQKFGSVNRIKTILDHLEKNPTIEALDELQGCPELGWGVPEINTARAIFPKYLQLAAAN